MREENKALFASLETPSFKRVSLPENPFPLQPKKAEIEITSDPAIVLTPLDQVNHRLGELDRRFTRSLGPKFFAYANGHYTEGLHIFLDDPSGKQHTVKLALRPEDDTVINLFIEATDRSKLQVILDVKSETPLTHHGLTRILGGKESEISLVKLQRLQKDSTYFDQNIAFVQDYGKFTLYDVQLGSHTKLVNYQTELEGYKSRSDMKNLYFGDGDNGLDLSFSNHHIGAFSDSAILSKGALNHKARKTFRGNLSFAKGSRQAVGKEEEFVILLDPKVKSDSIPALMCDEDDVIGEHAASVGKIDGNKLFYLMSRGLSEDAAKKLIVSSSYAEVLKNLSLPSLVTEIMEDVEARMDHAL